MKSRLLLVLLIVFSCTKEEEIVMVYPRVKTDAAIVSDSNGSTFRADVTVPGNQAIIEHGFEWRSGTLVRNSALTDRVSLGALNATSFQHKVTYGLIGATSYVMRAYVKTSTLTVFGDLKEFAAGGSLPPRVEAISPSTGTWGDTVAIRGSNFTYLFDVLEVKLGSSPVRVISQKDSTIKVIIPDYFLEKTPTTATVKVLNQQTTSAATFTLLPAEITSVSPNRGGSGTTVVVKGKYFHPETNTVSIGGRPVVLDFVDTGEIHFKIPKETPGGAVTLTVATGAAPLEYNNAFYRVSPVITDVSPSEAFFGDVITIKGENFGRTYTDNQVVFGSSLAEIVEVGTGEIKIKYPEGYAANPSVRVTADFASSTADFKVTLRAPKVTSISPAAGLYPGNEITVNGDYFMPDYFKTAEGYTVEFGGVVAEEIYSSDKTELTTRVPLINNFTSSVRVTIFGQSSPETVSVATVVAASNMPGPNRVGSAGFAIGSVGYVVSGRDQFGHSDASMYAFDDNNRSWARMDDFPGAGRDYASGFSIGNKGYIMGGGYPDERTDLWRYDPSSDHWDKLNDLPFNPVEAFNIQGEIFVLSNHADMDYQPRLWKYNVGADSWSQVALLPIQVDNTIEGKNYFGMAVGTKLVMGILSGSSIGMYVYDKSTNTWTQKGARTLPDDDIYGFEYNGVALIMTSRTLYKFNVTTGAWTEFVTNLQFLGGNNPTTFKTGARTHFGLFRLNNFIGDADPHLRNLFWTFDGQLSGL
jgi:hypothetical protein